MDLMKIVFVLLKNAFTAFFSVLFSPNLRKQLFITAFLAQAICLEHTHAQTQLTQNTLPGSQASIRSKEDLSIKLKSFLAPEMGLNDEIKAALGRIEQACDLGKTKLAQAQPMSATNAKVIKEITETRELVAAQQSQFEVAVSSFRKERGLDSKACSPVLSLFKSSEQCVRFQNDTSTQVAVSNTAQSYYSEALLRLKSYETAVELEGKGCTRPNFGFKLWSAEQVHITPKLKTSAELLAKFLN